MAAERDGSTAWRALSASDAIHLAWPMLAGPLLLGSALTSQAGGSPSDHQVGGSPLTFRQVAKAMARVRMDRENEGNFMEMGKMGSLIGCPACKTED